MRSENYSTKKRVKMEEAKYAIFAMEKENKM